MSVDTSGIELEIVNDLTIELRNEPTFDADILALKVKLAVKDVINYRNYAVTSYTNEQILDDLYSLYSTICDIARYDYNKLGGEGEAGHSENGISRTYVSRDSLFSRVFPFVKFL